MEEERRECPEDPSPQVFRLDSEGNIVVISSAARRAIEAALIYADRYRDKSSGLILGDERNEPDARTSFFCALALMMGGEPDHLRSSRALFSKLERMGWRLDAGTSTLILHHLGRILPADLRRIFERSILSPPEDTEDDMIGRNINIPLSIWTSRIAAGLMRGRPEPVEEGLSALERLLDLVADHGTIPEFNSPTYHPITLLLLRVLSLLGEPRTSLLSSRLERHLWTEVAWRWHPLLRQLCGPWGRAYHDSLVGGSGLILMLADIMWGAFYDESVAFRYQHAHDLTFAPVLTLLAHGHPVDVKGIALEKDLPVTVKALAEQISVRFGDDEHTSWVPGGIAELTTWMDRNLAVGTASRSHIHAIQNGTYVAQWTRTGKPVKNLNDLGQAFMRLAQNGRRPGEGSHQTYRNHYCGDPLETTSKLWADDGQPYALQSGPTSLVVYVPKGWERWWVRKLEVMTVIPRLDTVDDVIVNGVQVDTYQGSFDEGVIVRSGKASLGLRFAACAPDLFEPYLFVERHKDHLLVGLCTAEFPTERELPESTYRRYGASVGSELRYAPTEGDVGAFVRDLESSEIGDTWPGGFFGYPREVFFQIGSTLLRGRFDPVSGSWLHRETPEPPGKVVRINFPRNPPQV